MEYSEHNIFYERNRTFTLRWRHHNMRELRLLKFVVRGTAGTQ